MIMGLRTELAAGDGFDWTQQGLVKSSTGGAGITARPVRPPPQQQKQRQQQQAAASQQQTAASQLRCPRCDSANTKFCYYNNYSRAQPRHFCKSCRRHWTAGGTLRNVPVGGGRKAKRPKTSLPSSSAATTADDANTTMPSSSSKLLPPMSFPLDHLFPSALLPSVYANSTTGYLGAGGYSFSASAAFSPFLSLTGQEEYLAAGIIASDMGVAPGGSTATLPTPWELLPPPPGPPTCSGGGSGSSSSGLTSALDSSSSPSSGYWGSCWEDLSSLLSIDLEQHPPPAPAGAAAPQHLYNFDLS